MRSLLGAVSLATVAFLSPLAVADEVRWIEDFDRGLALAVEQKKDLFVEFTGSDWCPPCKALYRDVLSKPAFTEALNEQFVFVKLDFPRAAELKAKVPNATRNQEVLKEFKVEGYPTILLMTPEKVPYARTVGYGGQGLDGYITFIRDLHKDGRASLPEVQELVASFGKTSGEARLPLVERAIALADKLGESPLTERLLPVLRAGLELDPENARGLAVRTLSALLKIDAATEEEIERAGALDPRNEHGLAERVLLHHMKNARSEDDVRGTLDRLDALLEHGLRDDDLAKGVLANALYWCANALEDRERAQRYGDLLLQRFPGDEKLAGFIREQLAGESD